jgi:hypothetical protein
MNMEQPEGVAIIPSRPFWLRLLAVVGGLVLAGSIIFVGLRVGQTVLGEGPIDALGGQLQQLQTTSGTYVGRITEVRRGYVVLAEPAVVTAQAAADGEATEYLVEALASEPYGISGEITIREEQIVLAGAVASDSGLAGAYEAATTGQSEPDTVP